MADRFLPDLIIVICCVFYVIGLIAALPHLKRDFPIFFSSNVNARKSFTAWVKRITIGKVARFVPIYICCGLVLATGGLGALLLGYAGLIQVVASFRGTASGQSVDMVLFLFALMAVLFSTFSGWVMAVPIAARISAFLGKIKLKR